MKGVIYSGILTVTIVSLLSAQTEACSAASVPGRLSCNVADAIAPTVRRADDVPAGPAARASMEAAEQARVRTSMEHLETTTRQRTDMVKAAQEQSARTQREIAVRTERQVPPSVPKSVELETQKRMQREAQQTVQKAQHLAPPAPVRDVVRPEASAARLQQLKTATTPQLPKDAKNSIGAAIHGAETSAAATTARQQQKLGTETQERAAQSVQKAPRLAEAKLIDNAALAKQQQAQKAPKPAPGTAASARARAGTATYNGKLAHVNDPNWLTGRTSSPLPGQVAQRLAGRKFNNFDNLRENIWREIGNDPVLSRSFGPGNVELMRAGKAPYAVTSQHRGQRMRYELDHSDELRDGGPVYDLNNLRIKTPDAHARKITRDFNLASGVR